MTVCVGVGMGIVEGIVTGIGLVGVGSVVEVEEENLDDNDSRNCCIHSELN
jgi:hypothetical protein